MFLRTASLVSRWLILGVVGLLPMGPVWAQTRAPASPVVALQSLAAEQAALDEGELVGAYFLSHAYPNPFNPQTQLRFAVAEAQGVKVTLHDMLGRQLRVLYEGTPEARKLQAVTIDGRRLTTGLYVVRLAGPNFVTTRTITLVK